MDAAQYAYFQNELNRLLEKKAALESEKSRLEFSIMALTSELEDEEKRHAKYVQEQTEIEQKLTNYNTMKTKLIELRSSLRNLHGNLCSVISDLGSLIEGDSVKKEEISGLINTPKDQIWTYYSSVVTISNEAGKRIEELDKAKAAKIKQVNKSQSNIDSMNNDIYAEQVQLTSIKNEIAGIEPSIRFYQEQI